MNPRRLHKLTIFSIRWESVALIGTELTADYADVADNTNLPPNTPNNAKKKTRN
jgi:hypothetical protein